MSAIDWLPCPFCGGPATYRTSKDEALWSHEIVDWHDVSCGNCEIGMRGCDDLRDAWNQRSDGEPVERCHRCHKPIACESDFDAYGEHAWNCDCDPCRARCWGHTNCHLIAPPATLADERTAGELVTANARRARFKESHDRVLAAHAETFRALADSETRPPDWRTCPCPECAHVRSVDAALTREQRVHAAALGVVEAARRLRDSGYDGPFIGEVTVELFAAVAAYEGAGR